MSDPILLTDTDDPSVHDAMALLDGWRLELAPERELADAVLRATDARAVLVTTDNPNALRDVVQRARERRLPVLVGCRDETARRRAVELRVDEWLSLPASADEVAGRVKSAVARSVPSGAAVADRIDRVEYEQMLYDFLTGLPTLPVVIERTRAMFKERGELVVLYFNFVRY